MIAQRDVSQKLRVRTDEFTLAHLRVSIAGCFAGSSQCDTVQQRDIVSDSGPFPYDDSCAVIEKDIGTDLGCRMSVDTLLLVDKTPNDEQLVVVCIGLSTNLASAVKLAPEIVPKLKVYGLGFQYNVETGVWN